MFPTWDGELLLRLQELTQSKALDFFFIRFTALGDFGIIWILTGLVLLFFKQTRRSGVLMLVSLLLTHLLNNLFLKELINRPRPYESLMGVRHLIAEHHESSFPSGHASTAFGSGFVLVLREKNFLRPTALVLAVLLAFSRLYVGMHYPLDVLVGSAVGILMASLLVYGDRLIQSQINRRRTTGSRADITR